MKRIGTGAGERELTPEQYRNVYLKANHAFNFSGDSIVDSQIAAGRAAFDASMFYLAARRAMFDAPGAGSPIMEDERIKALEAKLDRLDTHSELAALWERKYCAEALAALSGAGVCTPEETFGTNVGWAVGDLCRAVEKLKDEVDRLQSALAACNQYAYFDGPGSEAAQKQVEAALDDQTKAGR